MADMDTGNRKGIWGDAINLMEDFGRNSQYNGSKVLPCEYERIIRRGLLYLIMKMLGCIKHLGEWTKQTQKNWYLWIDDPTQRLI